MNTNPVHNIVYGYGKRGYEETCPVLELIAFSQYGLMILSLYKSRERINRPFLWQATLSKNTALITKSCKLAVKKSNFMCKKIIFRPLKAYYTSFARSRL
jgi:hypothetical protein